MLTLVESLSLAGDRAKQNDDAFGAAPPRAWVIDGATDLHDEPISGAASDAAWIAQRANAFFHGQEGDPRVLFAAAAADARDFFDAPEGVERWKLPTASALMILETPDGIAGIDLGDSRCFVLDANGAAFAFGARPAASDRETKDAARFADNSKTDAPALSRPDVLAHLRAQRARHNTEGGYWVFGLDPEAARHARAWDAALARPAHIVLATDGFAALVDRYAAYDAGSLVAAALEKGLAELGRELRAIETADSNGARHPRFKPSDDATALLLRLT